jgi:hypothetical protein
MYRDIGFFNPLSKNGAAKLCSQLCDFIVEFFVGVEVLGSQPDLHLGEEMVIAWRQFRTVSRVAGYLSGEALD